MNIIWLRTNKENLITECKGNADYYLILLDLRFIVSGCDTVWGSVRNKKRTPKSICKVYAKYMQQRPRCFPLFVEEWILWNPLWVSLKQTRGNNCPPLPMRLLCLGLCSKTHCFWVFLKKYMQKYMQIG